MQLSELLLYAMYEARKHKWEKSNVENKDVGYCAIEDWFHTKFYHWYRDRLIEHLEGMHNWKEFGEKDFDLHHKGFHPNKKLVDRIFDNLTKHRQNISEQLGMLCGCSSSELPDTMDILSRIDMNNKRCDISEEQLKCLDDAFQEAEVYKWIESQKQGKDLGETAIKKWFDDNWNKWMATKHPEVPLDN